VGVGLGVGVGVENGEWGVGLGAGSGVGVAWGQNHMNLLGDQVVIDGCCLWYECVCRIDAYVYTYVRVLLPRGTGPARGSKGSGARAGVVACIVLPLHDPSRRHVSRRDGGRITCHQCAT